MLYQKRCWCRRNKFAAVLSFLLVLSLIPPLPVFSKKEAASNYLAPKNVPARDLVAAVQDMIEFTVRYEAERRQRVPALLDPPAAQPVWDSQGCKLLGTMLEPNPDSSFTFPKFRRAQGFPRIPRPAPGPKQKEIDAAMKAKGYTPSGNFYHARPTKIIEERILDFYQDEILMTPELKAAIFKIVRSIGAEVAAKKLTKEEWPAIVASKNFEERVQAQADIRGKTLKQVIYILNKLGTQIVDGELNLKKPDDLETAFSLVMDNFLGPDEVIVESIAAGLNPNGDWAATGFPISVLGGHKAKFHVLGSDLYGRVVKIGSGIAKMPDSQEGALRVGDMVVFQTGIHPVRNPQVHGGHPFKVPGAHITGYEDPFGTFTDFYKFDQLAFMKVTEDEVLRRIQMMNDRGEVETGVPVEVMASYGLVLPTVEHASNRLGLDDDKIVIMEGGNGGTGRYGIQVIKKRGSKVIAVVSSEARGQEVLKLGADAYINRRSTKLVQVADALYELRKLAARTTVASLKKDILTLANASSLTLDQVNSFIAVMDKEYDGQVDSQLLTQVKKQTQVLIEVEKEKPGFLERAIRVLSAKATYEDMEEVHADYIKMVKRKVREIKNKYGLRRDSDLADAVINFMGTETYGRHEMSVREGDPFSRNDLGGQNASFGGGSGFKVQFPGAGGTTPLTSMMKRIKQMQRRMHVSTHVKRVVVMGATEEAREEVEKMVKTPGCKVLVVVKTEEEKRKVLDWGLLRQGKDGVILTSRPKYEIIDYRNLPEGSNVTKFLSYFHNARLFEKNEALIFVETKAEKESLIQSGIIDKNLEKVFSEEECEIVRDLNFVTEEQVTAKRRTGRNYIMLAKNPAEKKTIFSWKIWSEKGMFDPTKDIVFENYGVVADLDSPMPDTPSPLEYEPSAEELEAQAKKEKAYSAWVDAGPKGLGKAIWQHWGKRTSPDLIFGRAEWENALSRAIFVLDPFGILAIRGDTSEKVYDFDIRHFWMSQKVIAMPRKTKVGTHYASVKECHDAHGEVREGNIKLAPVKVYPWNQLAEAQEKLGTGKNVVLIGAPTVGLSTLADIRQANVKRFIQMMSSGAFEQREFAAAQLHYLADTLADKVIATYQDSPELEKLLYKPSTCGVCVEEETFNKIHEAWGKPHIHVVEHQNAKEFELHLGGGVYLDILTPIKRRPAESDDDQEKGRVLQSGLVNFLNNQGEGLQQVEIFTSDVREVMKHLAARAAAGKGSKAIWEEPKIGTTGTPVNFNLVKLPDGRKVLLEFVQATEEQLAALREEEARAARRALPREEPFSASWLAEVRSSLDSSI